MNKLLLIGGVALLLSACDSATAPISQHDGPEASLKQRPTIGAPKSGPVMQSLSSCEFLHQGGDSTVANPICIAQ
jgi:hypothetical protein